MQRKPIAEDQIVAANFDKLLNLWLGMNRIGEVDCFGISCIVWKGVSFTEMEKQKMKRKDGANYAPTNARF